MASVAAQLMLLSCFATIYLQVAAALHSCFSEFVVPFLCLIKSQLECQYQDRHWPRKNVSCQLHQMWTNKYNDSVPIS